MSSSKPFLVLVVPWMAVAAAAGEGNGDQRCWGMHSRCDVSGNLRVARRVEPPPERIAKLFAGKPFRAYEIDLDGDGRPDYVVQEGEPAPAPSRTCFVDSAARIRSCEPSGGDGFAYYWFTQLDGDAMLELWSMEGDDDSSDYRIQKLDPKTWKRRDVVRIDPVLVTDEGDPRSAYWGYPWDVRDVILRRGGGRVLLRAAPAGAREPDMLELREDLGEPPNVQILFRGTPTQGEPGHFVRAVEASRFMALDAVVRLSRGSPPKAAGPAQR